MESVNNEVLSAGMRSLTVTFAKGVGKGRIQLARYHLHVLRGLRETRNAVHYVLFNKQRHGGRKVGEYSSILQEKDALSLIKAYVRKKRVTLILGKKDEFEELSVGKSYIIRKALGS